MGPFDEAQGPRLEERAQIATSVERMGSLVEGVSTKCRARCSEVQEKMEFEGVGALVLAGQTLRWPSRQLRDVFLVTQVVQCKSICSRFGVRIRLWQEQMLFTEEWHQLSVKWDAVVGQNGTGFSSTALSLTSNKVQCQSKLS